MSTIPASEIVAVTPSVLSAGGSALDLSGLMLSSSTRIPIGAVESFASADAVATYFGATSDEAAKATIYFSGFDNSSLKPGALLAAQYNTDDVGAFLRGGNLSDMTLAELQAINGELSIVVDGATKSGTINLAAATSFSNAAARIGQTLAMHGPQAASVTGAISGTTLTVSAVGSGTIEVGQVLSGTGVTANTYISALGTGTGGTGTYTVSTSQTALSEAITIYEAGVSYDSVADAFLFISPTTGASSTIDFATGATSDDLLLTEDTGAVVSQGADTADPTDFMDALVQETQNWATFFTLFDPDGGSGNDNKLALAAWTSGRNNRFGYIVWDHDASAAASIPATSSLGYEIVQADYTGSFVVYDTDASTAAFVAGIGASLDFEETNGRADFCFRAQAGLTAQVTDETSYTNLLANGYNFYGVYATGNDQFRFLRDGHVSGPFAWMDSFVNQIWLSNAFQLALMNLLTQAKSIPYNAAGNTQIEASLSGTITTALNFGAIRAGVTLSGAQVAQVNAAAGVRISDVLQTRGWYLQVLPASPTVRAARGSPPCTFWYTDGGSVQTVNLSSVEIQ